MRPLTFQISEMTTIQNIALKCLSNILKDVRIYYFWSFILPTSLVQATNNTGSLSDVADFISVSLREDN